jgi:hypothetical protein
MEGANDMTSQSKMQTNHDAENTTGAAQIEADTGAMSVDQLNAQSSNAIEMMPIRTIHTKMWLQQLYPAITWMLAPQPVSTPTVSTQPDLPTAPDRLSPVFPSFTAVRVTPGLPATTKMPPGTPIWIPGTPEHPRGVYGQMLSQHANARIVGSSKNHNRAVSSLAVLSTSNPNVDASPYRPAIKVCICGFHGCILDQSNKTCFASVSRVTDRYHLANRFADRGWGFCSEVDPGQRPAAEANHLNAFAPSSLKMRAMQKGVVQFLPGIDLSEVELDLEMEEMYGVKEDIFTAIEEHWRVVERLEDLLGTKHGAGPVWPCMWLDNEVMWLARRSDDVTE